jgi:hypothetical protein
MRFTEIIPLVHEYICDSIIRIGRVIGIVNVVPSLRPAKLEVEDVDGDQR